MIQTLKVQCFRKLKDKTFDFTGGLNVIRGANEAGKSTLLEALAYAFFGVKGCRSPLEDMVTWGEPVAKLKVELTFTLEGSTYYLKRSKSGAEMSWCDNSAEIRADRQTHDMAGGTVTGQSEVTAKIGRLFGVQPADMANLMLAQQGKIRGALDEGSKKTSELIEQLADFNIIDRVITLIGDKLLTGAPAPFEEKIGRLTPELAECEAALAVVPNTDAQEARLAEIVPLIAWGDATAAGVLAELEPACAARDAAKKLLAERDQLRARLDLLVDQAAAAEVAFQTLQGKAPPAPDNERMEDIQRLLADVTKVAQMRAMRQEIVSMVQGDTFWTGTVEDFNNETNRVKARLQVVQKELSELTAEAREKRAQRIAGSFCGVCNKDFSEIPEVEVKNHAIDVRLGLIAARESDLRNEMRDLAGGLQDLEGVYSEHSKVERLAARYGELARVDRGFVPWRLSWGGPELPADDGGTSLRDEMGKLRRAETDLTVWKTRLQAADDAWKKATDATATARSAVENPRFTQAEAELPSLENACADLNDKYAEAVQSVYDMKDEANALRTDIASKRSVYDAAKAKVESVRKQLADANRDLAAVSRNNALLKRVRVARPIVANKLWSRVLAAVSRYFSQMRSEESVVSKDGDGFKVNGKLIENFSGSALDLLGLAIRLALVRTFLPHAPFIILDEPASACEDTRTESMMGFLVACGFNQMLIVTHEDLSEKVASSLIEI